jgi:myo-inositol-1(or 4)-monophosphatase
MLRGSAQAARLPPVWGSSVEKSPKKVAGCNLVVTLRAMLTTALRAAREAGDLLRRNFGKPLRANEITAHDIKLEMDVRAQQTIERCIMRSHPTHAILGEEGIGGKFGGDYRWIVDPLDGTVNYAYGIPQFCVSIACQKKTDSRTPTDRLTPGWDTVAGVIYDPVRDEMFAAARDGAATLNGKRIRVSRRRTLSDAIVSVGFFKTSALIDQSMPHFKRLAHRARKVRIMGAAALDLAYVACGRYDVYLEYGVKLWDIAAGLLILERAGGVCELKPTNAPHSFNVLSSGMVSRAAVMAGRKL